jgi:cyclic beta-1,2-glucan synthetase
MDPPSGSIAWSLPDRAALGGTERPTAPPELEAERLGGVADRAHATALEMDFRFLFDEERKLFSIGYQHGTTRWTSYYDLLASEARLASFVAIAKNDVPVEHWFRLGARSRAPRGDGARLVEREHVRVPDAGAGDALVPVHAAGPDVRRRGAPRRSPTARERGVPWGVSESAYNLRDRHLTYQYRAFGVPTSRSSAASAATW